MVDGMVSIRIDGKAGVARVPGMPGVAGIAGSMLGIVPGVVRGIVDGLVVGLVGGTVLDIDVAGSVGVTVGDMVGVGEVVGFVFLILLSAGVSKTGRLGWVVWLAIAGITTASANGTSSRARAVIIKQFLELVFDFWLPPAVLGWSGRCGCGGANAPASACTLS